MSQIRPIIIKKCKCPPPAHHSSAWKIAFADLLLALMAFFMIMWLLEVMTPEQKSAVAKYFAQRTLTESEGSNDATIANSKGTSAGIIDLGGGLNTSENYKMEVPVEQSNVQDLGSRGVDGASDSLIMIFQILASALKELSDEEVTIALEDTVIRLTIASDMLYAPGAVELTKESLSTLKKIAQILVNDFHSIRVEGHSDALDTGDNQVKSNWGLSALRAANVSAFLTNSGISGERIQAIGFGEYKPKGTNITKEGRYVNRRVDIIIGGIYAN